MPRGAPVDLLQLDERPAVAFGRQLFQLLRRLAERIEVVDQDLDAPVAQRRGLARREPVGASLEQRRQIGPALLAGVEPLEGDHGLLAIGGDRQGRFVSLGGADRIVGRAFENLGSLQQAGDRLLRLVGLGRRRSQRGHHLGPAAERAEQRDLLGARFAVAGRRQQRLLEGGQRVGRAVQLLALDAGDLAPDPRRRRGGPGHLGDPARLGGQGAPGVARPRVGPEPLPEIVVGGQEAQHDDLGLERSLGRVEPIAKQARHLAQRRDLLARLVLQIEPSQQQLDQPIPALLVAQRGLGAGQDPARLGIAGVAGPAVEQRRQIDVAVRRRQLPSDRAGDLRQAGHRFGGPAGTGEDREAGAQLPDHRFAIRIGLLRKIEEEIVRSPGRRMRGQPGREPDQIGIAGAKPDQHQGPAAAQLIEPGHPGGREQAQPRVGRAQTEALRQRAAAAQVQQWRVGPAELRARRGVDADQDAQGIAAPGGGGQRAGPLVVEGGGHHRAPGKIGGLADAVGQGGPVGEGLSDRLLDLRRREKIADQRQRVAQPPGGGEAGDLRAHVREHRTIGERRDEGFPARGARELAATKTRDQNDLTRLEPLDERVGNLDHRNTSAGFSLFIARNRPPS